MAQNRIELLTRGDFPRYFCEISIAIIYIQICLQHKNNMIFGTSWDSGWPQSEGENFGCIKGVENNGEKDHSDGRHLKRQGDLFYSHPRGQFL